ncbi:MAG: RluA family pseudouridine synthase [Myxococcota bacterium]|nr:RluA family pseudouridine synthase [Myxococcota bacterium]
MDRPANIPSDWLAFEFIVRPGHAGWRVDLFISSRMPRLSRNRVQKLIKRAAFDSRGKPLRPAHTLAAGEIVTIFRPPLVEPEVPRNITIVWEDEHLVAVNKPPRLPVHPTARFHKNTLIHLLEERYGEGHRPNLAHRIDSETSGLVVCTKQKEAERGLKIMFQKRQVEKWYLAVVQGIPEPVEGRIEAPMGLNEGGQIYIKMVVREDGLPSLTEYAVLQAHKDRALVECRPRTGRQHQLRVHLAHIGHPIVGDKIYGTDTELFLDIKNGVVAEDDIQRRAGALRHLLHAWRMRFAHPVTGEILLLEAPLPDDMRAAMER